MLLDVYGLLHRLGITANYTGFFHAAYAVSLSLENMEHLLEVTKYLLPEVAKHYNTTPYCVEKNIRTITKLAWAHNPEMLMLLANRKLTEQPTVSEFIAILASYFAFQGILQ